MTEPPRNPLSTAQAMFAMLVRLGVVAMALSGVATTAGVFFWFVPGSNGPEGDRLFALLALGALLVVAALGWWLAPRLARRTLRPGSIDDTPTPRAWLVLPFVLLGIWFAGTGLSELASLPAHALTLKAIAESGNYPSDDLWLALRTPLVKEAVRVVFGLVLVLGAGRFATWVERR